MRELSFANSSFSDRLFTGWVVRDTGLSSWYEVERCSAFRIGERP